CGSPPSLALCLSVHAERPRLRFRVGRGRWLAFSVASPDRPARRTEDVSLLCGLPSCQTQTPPLAASALQHKIQRTSTRRVLCCSGRRTAIRRHGLGDSQTHAAVLACWDRRWL